MTDEKDFEEGQANLSEEDKKQEMAQRHMERFNISEDEAHWLSKMLSHKHSKGLHPSTFVAILRSLTLEKVREIDSTQFIELVWKRAESASPKSVEKRRKLREKANREALLKSIKDREAKEWKILAINASIPIKRKSMSSFSTNIRTQTRAEIQKEFNRLVVKAARCDLLLEVLDHNLDIMQKFLNQQYPHLNNHVLRLIAETDEKGADTKEASEIKEEIRPLLSGEVAAVAFFKQIRILLNQVEERKVTYIKSVDAEEGFEKLAYTLGLEENTIRSRYTSITSRLRPDYESKKLQMSILQRSLPPK